MPVALQGPANIRVEGRVADAETGAPIDSVDVLMVSGRIFIDEVGHASVTTGADGLYEISHLFEGECPGDLRLSVWPGSSEYQRPASVDLECTGGVRQVSFELARRENATVPGGTVGGR